MFFRINELILTLLHFTFIVIYIIILCTSIYLKICTMKVTNVNLYKCNLC